MCRGTLISLDLILTHVQILFLSGEPASQWRVTAPKGRYRSQEGGGLDEFNFVDTGGDDAMANHF